MIRVRVGVERNIKSVMEVKSDQYYRVTVDGVGIYEAVARDCPKDDPRRAHKPDGSWLEKKGEEYPSSISYWTAEGFKQYQTSGLFDWHRSVVEGIIEVTAISRPSNILYEDASQIIVEQTCPCGPAAQHSCV